MKFSILLLLLLLHFSHGQTPSPVRTPSPACASNPCLNGGYCMPKPNATFSCSCLQGYSGPRCSQDVDECQHFKGGCNHNCINSKGSFTCECRPGFYLMDDGFTCMDEDECKIGNHSCTQVCNNEDGAYSCACHRGYRLTDDKYTCIDVNECMTMLAARCQHRCSNTVGSFKCVCAPGFRLQPNGRNCTDIDECSEKTSNCDSYCENTKGSFKCLDFDPSLICPRILVNGDPYYQSMRQGVYHLTKELECDGREVYVMLETSMFLYYANKTNRWLVSSNPCSVMAGIRSAPNKTFPNDAVLGDWNVAFSSRWINSTITTLCLKDSYDCNNELSEHPCEHDCRTTAGGGYVCECPRGYNISEDSHSCIDNDECLIPTSCSEYCINTDGSFNCLTVDSEDMCQKLLLVTGDSYQSARAGTYNLDVNSTCGGRPVWKQNGRANYLYYLHRTKFWVIGATPCGDYVGVLVEGHAVAPWQVEDTDWKHWNGSSWVVAEDMHFTCLKEGCAENEFLCGNNQCVPEYWVCDNWDDCGDNSDEQGCPCEEGSLQCDDGQCISGVFRSVATDWCDGVTDCDDGSDESPDCQCLDDVQFRCGGNDTRKCVNSDWVCDGDRDCLNGADEMGCNCTGFERACPNNGLCISQYWFCDGEDDCGDFSDELNCTCQTDEFTCDMGMCIPARYYCNGIEGCPDGSDEPANCTCLPGLHECDNGQCLLQSDICDGFYDCDDLTDEENCECPSYQEKCQNGNCYYRSWKCDGDNDCGDFTDETGCECLPERFKCDDLLCTNGLKEEVFCNGIVECMDGSDEPANCSDSCMDTQIHCDGQCMSKTLVCDGKFDCTDHSDEQNCSCSSTENRCNNSLCLRKNNWCDGYNDCGDWSDENSCNCTEEEFRCDNGVCLGQYFWCNGIPNCPDESDEKENCGCLGTQHQCAAGKCITQEWVCDGFRDCEDGSDEFPHQTCTCTADERTCTSGECVSVGQWCNQRIDCIDQSDEQNCTCDPAETYTCASGICIKAEWECDGDDDCRDLSDERHCPCENDENNIQKYRCFSNAQCIHSTFVCDGLVDCPDAEDEANCHNCTANQRACNDYSCVDKTKWCDGRPDCRDHSDEFYCVKEQRVTVANSTYSLVAVAHDSEWVPICSYYWNDTWADVACRQLGYGSVSQSYMVDDRRNSTDVYGRAHPTVVPSLRLHEALTFEASCDSRKVVTVRCNEKSCGQRSTRLIDRPGSFVTNGEHARDGMWPWMASITVEEAGGLFCGGTLISSRWIATSAHCVEEQDDLSMFIVRLGTIHRVRRDGNARTYGVRRIVTHPSYLTNTDADLALIELDSPVQTSEYIRPLCLPEHGQNFTNHRQCYIAGWGARRAMPSWLSTTVDNLADILQTARMLLLSYDRCEDSGTLQLDNEPYQFDKNITMCAGYIDGHSSACDGDSGSPLMCENEEGTWTLAGITMAGSKDCDTYSVFTTVAPFIPWITQTMATDGTTYPPPTRTRPYPHTPTTPYRMRTAQTTPHGVRTTTTTQLPSTTTARPVRATPSAGPPAPVN